MKTKTEFYQSYFEILQKKGFTVQPSTSPDYVADIYHKDKLIAFFTKNDMVMKNPFVEVQDKLMDRIQTLAKSTAVACGICSDKPFDEETAVKLPNNLYRLNEHSSLGLVTAIFGLIFVVCYFVLYFQFLMRGLEIMILRIGLPLACVGLLDNDKGVFKTYINKFFQSTLAVVVQICLCKLGVGMMMNVGINMNIFWGIACIVLAIKTPRFLSEFMVPAGGGAGMINNVYHSVRLVGMAKGMIK